MRATERVLVPGPLLFLLLLQTGSSLAVGNDFGSYPEKSRPCLYSSADDAGCSEAPTGAELNQCLCRNHNDFIYNAATCIGEKDYADAGIVYDTIASNCAGTGVTVTVPREAFLGKAKQAVVTTTMTTMTTMTTTSQSTTSTSSTPTASTSTETTKTTGSIESQTNTGSPKPTTSDPPSQDEGLGLGAKIGIGVGIGFGAIAAALAAWFIWSYQNRRRAARSVHSVDAPGATGAFGMTSGPVHEYASNNASQGPAELASVAGVWKQTPNYSTTAYDAGAYHNNKKDENAGVPLLAELGHDTTTRQEAPVELPVELPGTPGYLGYNDPAAEHHQALGQGQQRGVTPDGISPGSARGDVSPFAPSHSSEHRPY